MIPTHVRVALTLSALAVMLSPVPLGMAQGGTFTHYGIFEAPIGAYAYEQAQVFQVYLEAGDTISASLEWFDATTDLDLTLLAPGGSCVVLPEPDTDCLGGSAAGRVDCSGSTTPFPMTPGPRSWSRVAKVSGWYDVAVEAAFATSATPVQYILQVDIDGAGSTADIYRDTDTNYLHPAPCRLLN